VEFQRRPSGLPSSSFPHGTRALSVTESRGTSNGVVRSSIPPPLVGSTQCRRVHGVPTGLATLSGPSAPLPGIGLRLALAIRHGTARERTSMPTHSSVFPWALGALGPTEARRSCPPASVGTPARARTAEPPLRETRPPLPAPLSRPRPACHECPPRSLATTDGFSVDSSPIGY